MKNILTLIIGMFPFMVWSAQIKDFDSIWQQLYLKSFHQESAKQEKMANDLALDRAHRHWLPRVYLQGQWFSTNDPGAIFFNNLGQRSVEQLDFIPKTLNHPEREDFKNATVGLDLPLYEGGFKSAQVSLFKNLLKSSELEQKAKKSQEYAELANKYGATIIHRQHKQQLYELQNNLKNLISSYQVGAKSNPIGHSGLLGLKSVSNRIEGVISQIELKFDHAKEWINVRIGNSESWDVESSENIKSFVERELDEKSAESYSSMMMAHFFKAESMNDIKSMEKARFLPRLGLFAQNNMYSGARDTANSQAFGLYLAWDIFNNDSFGRIDEAAAKARAAEAKINAAKQEEQIMRNDLNSTKKTLEKNLTLLSESESLLKEQTQNAMKLFNSGMLNALQLAEVINRRVDLIENKNQVESNYLEVQTRLYQIHN